MLYEKNERRTAVDYMDAAKNGPHPWPEALQPCVYHEEALEIYCTLQGNRTRDRWLNGDLLLLAMLARTLAEANALLSQLQVVGRVIGQADGKLAANPMHRVHVDLMAQASNLARQLKLATSAYAPGDGTSSKSRTEWDAQARRERDARDAVLDDGEVSFM